MSKPFGMARPNTPSTVALVILLRRVRVFGPPRVHVVSVMGSRRLPHLPSGHGFSLPPPPPRASLSDDTIRNLALNTIRTQQDSKEAKGSIDDWLLSWYSRQQRNFCSCWIAYRD